MVLRSCCSLFDLKLSSNSSKSDFRHWVTPRSPSVHRLTHQWLTTLRTRGNHRESFIDHQTHGASTEIVTYNREGGTLQSRFGSPFSLPPPLRPHPLVNVQQRPIKANYNFNNNPPKWFTRSPAPFTLNHLGGPEVPPSVVYRHKFTWWTIITDPPPS